MNHKQKQEWIEAIMADSKLTPATAKYAFGIYKHMYGTKDESWPGAKALREATALNDSQFYKYNRALIEAGYLEVTSRKGTSNHYRLTLPTSIEGMYLPSEEVTLPPQEVTPTLTEGTNTTSNTSNESIKENPSTSASAPVVDSLIKETWSCSISSLKKDMSASPLPFEEKVTANGMSYFLFEDGVTGPVPVLEEESACAPEPLPDTRTSAPVEEHRIARDKRLQEELHQTVLADMGIDMDGDW